MRLVCTMMALLPAWGCSSVSSRVANKCVDELPHPSCWPDQELVIRDGVAICVCKNDAGEE